MTTPVQSNYVGLSNAAPSGMGQANTVPGKAPSTNIGAMLAQAKALIPGNGQRDGMGNLITAKQEVLASKQISKFKLAEQIKALDTDLANPKLPQEQKNALEAKRRASIELLAKVESEVKTVELEISSIQKNVQFEEIMGKNKQNGQPITPQLNLET